MPNVFHLSSSTANTGIIKLCAENQAATRRFKICSSIQLERRRLTTKLSEVPHFQSAWAGISCSCWVDGGCWDLPEVCRNYRIEQWILPTPIIICPSSLSTERVRQRKKTPRLQAGNVEHCPKWQGKHKGKKEHSRDVKSEPPSEYNTGGTGSTLQTCSIMSRCSLTTHEQIENGRCEVNLN